MKNKWLTRAQYQKVFRFLGPRVVYLFLVGIAVGLSLFVAEIAFAYGLQGFLKAIGAINSDIIKLPKWVPSSSLQYVLVFIFLTGGLRCFLQWAQLFLQGAAAEELRFEQRNRLLRWAFNSESASSSHVAILFNDRTNSAAAVVQSLQALTIQVTSGVLLGATLLYFDPLLTLLVGAALALMIPPLRAFDKKISVSGKTLTAEGEKVNHKLLTSIRNLLLMQIYGTQQIEEAKAREGSSKIRFHHMIFYCFGALKFALPQLVGILLICLITVFARYWLHTPPGVLISYFYLFVRFLQTFSQISLSSAATINFWPQFMELAKWWADHSFDGVRNTRVIADNTNETFPISTPIGWQIKNLSFGYPGANTAPLFSKFNLSINPGKAVVITGPSGAGKSTLLNLILGTTKPKAGSIDVICNDERFELEPFRPHLLRRVGYVGAESFLIEGTVGENLLYGFQGIHSEADMKEALALAECGFVWEMPDQLNHRLTEQGQGLSAGQKQRLSLARALLRKPKVLILDEATANLDIETESKLVETLAQLKGQMTLVAVTHRQGLLKIADQHIELAGTASS